MATVFYDKAAVNVSFGDINETLLASNCSINFASPSQPMYAIGTKGSLGQFPAGARVGDMSFGFLSSITGDHHGHRGNIINYLASGIKNSVNSEASGVQITCAGVTGIGFLNSYSFNVASNSISTSSASFTFFGSGTQLPVAGFIYGETENNPIQTGILATGIVHGRYTSLTPLKTVIAAPTQTANIFAADYSLSMAHNPVYKIGQEFPTTSFYTTAQESVNVTEDVFDNALQFDESASDITLQLVGIGGSASADYMHVGIVGAKQQGTSMTAGLDDIIRTQKTLTAAY
jgi:hypothetical protein